MGENADDLIDGSCCSWCGCYFADYHGYPVVCKDCVKGYSKKQLSKLGLRVAIRNIRK